MTDTTDYEVISPGQPAANTGNSNSAGKVIIAVLLVLMLCVCCVCVLVFGSLFGAITWLWNVGDQIFYWGLNLLPWVI
jgi:hypothetical protein